MTPTEAKSAWAGIPLSAAVFLFVCLTWPYWLWRAVNDDLEVR